MPKKVNKLARKYNFIMCECEGICGFGETCDEAYRHYLDTFMGINDDVGEMAEDCEFFKIAPLAVEIVVHSSISIVGNGGE